MAEIRPLDLTDTEDRLSMVLDLLGYSERDDVRLQLGVLLRALDIYAERNIRYHDNWRRSGWRGVLVRIRERTDRLWDVWWERSQRSAQDADDALDLINFAAFFIRATGYGETTRDGSWW
jgi:hypothetical protein